MNKTILLTIVIFVLVFSLLQLGSLVNLLGTSLVGFSMAKTNPTVTSSSTEIKSTVAVKTKQEFLPEKIIIEAVNMNLPVVAVPLENGTWKVNEGVANFAIGTSLANPNVGNVGLYGHDLMNAFHKIKDLHAGDKVTLLGGKFRSVYQVESVSVVSPTDLAIFAPTKKPELTLMTCDGLFSSQRYVVHASLKEFYEN